MGNIPLELFSLGLSSIGVIAENPPPINEGINLSGVEEADIIMEVEGENGYERLFQSPKTTFCHAAKGKEIRFGSRLDGDKEVKISSYKAPEGKKLKFRLYHGGCFLHLSFTEIETYASSSMLGTFKINKV
ncbi:MAG: hypothetical protein N4A44_00550 [Alphaproteobacteria bacterium]|jgi:hypothetical protein|nr:hypothetical protein [Alphaproteobacteria bacterium]